MRRGWNWLLLAWPGLPHLWVRGSWTGLALAVGFTILASALLASWLVWTAWLPRSVQIVGAGFAVVAWGGSAFVAIRSRIVSEPKQAAGSRQRAEGRGEGAAESNTLFRRAQTEYLQGDWAAAERTLERLLDHNGRDIEALLLLATLCRHRHRLEEASEHLARLERMETSECWVFEIGTEREQLARAVTGQTAPAPVSVPRPELTPERADEVPEMVSFSHGVAENRPTGPLRAAGRGLPIQSDADTIGRTDAA